VDAFSNFQREEPFDPFTVMLFKGLQVVCFMFFLAFLAINPDALTGKIDTKAEFVITATWPDAHPDDIDLYIEDPIGNIVWYHQLEAGFMNLDRDDRGDFNNYVLVNGRRVLQPLRQETVSIRGIIPGEYVVNVLHYLATSPDPVQVKVKVEKMNPKVKVIYYNAFDLNHTGHEVTATRFIVAANGDVTEVNTQQKSLLRETRKVRGGGPPPTAARPAAPPAPPPPLAPRP
jgi:hypothetical protein